ncbi:MAG: ABC transporter substrate-binding protein [Gammaproteobacteria bacterium]
MSKTLYKLIVISLFLVSLALGSCSKQKANVIRFGLTSVPVTLDPRYATDATSSRIIRLLYAALVDFDESLMPSASLAQWEKISDTHYSFTLREGRNRFNNGMKLTAHDVKATYDSILDQAGASPHRVSLSNIEKVEVVDIDTVDFYLKTPDTLFPGRLTIGILPAPLIDKEHPFNQQPVGSGPFELIAWPDNTQLSLKRLRDSQVFEFIAVRDPTVRSLKLIRGEIDMMQNDIPPELIEYLQTQQNIVVERKIGSNFVYLGFNLNDKMTGNKAIRQAIAYALDRDSIIKYVLGGAARKATALLPPDHWAGITSLEPVPFDLQKSRRLLAQLGYSQENPLEISYKTSTDPFRLRLATIIQQQLAEAGITVKLKSYDWGTFYGDIKSGRFQMYSLMWVGIKLPDIFRYVFHSESIPPQGANRGRFVSDTADQLIAAAEAADTIQLQAQYYQRLQSHLFEELPYVPLWYEDHVLMKRKGIEGYQLARDGNYDSLVDTHRLNNSL